MNAVHIVLVATGAVLGALMRWQVGVWFNPIFPGVALGTLLVNVVGCFCPESYFLSLWRIKHFCF